MDGLHHHEPTRVPVPVPVPVPTTTIPEEAFVRMLADVLVSRQRGPPLTGTFACELPEGVGVGVGGEVEDIRGYAGSEPEAEVQCARAGAGAGVGVGGDDVPQGMGLDQGLDSQLRTLIQAALDHGYRRRRAADAEFKDWARGADVGVLPADGSVDGSELEGRLVDGSELEGRLVAVEVCGLGLGLPVGTSNVVARRPVHQPECTSRIIAIVRERDVESLSPRLAQTPRLGVEASTGSSSSTHSGPPYTGTDASQGSAVPPRQASASSLVRVYQFAKVVVHVHVQGQMDDQVPNSTWDNSSLADSGVLAGTGTHLAVAAQIRLHQHRTSVLSAFISHNLSNSDTGFHEACLELKLMRWDAAGLVVSSSSSSSSTIPNTTPTPTPTSIRQTLTRFFSLIGQMSDTQLGCDPTVTRALSSDAAMWRECVDGLPGRTAWERRVRERIKEVFADEGARWRVQVAGGDLVSVRRRWEVQAGTGAETRTDPETAKNDSEACVLVGPPTEPGRTRTLLVGRPFLSAGHAASASGRCTKGFIALDIEEKTFVFLKDSWRLDYRDTDLGSTHSRAQPEPELVVYASLKASGVANVPTVLYGGDVETHTQCVDRTVPVGTPAHAQQDSSVERTFNHHYIPTVCPRIHTRLVMREIGIPLDGYENTHELVRVVRDALLAHRDAYENAGILHGNVSVDNILIWQPEDSEVTAGLLSDWALAKPISLLNAGDAPQAARSGTWAFLSGACTALPWKPYLLADDLESFLHILGWLFLRWHAHALSGTNWAPELEDHVYATYAQSSYVPPYFVASQYKLGMVRLGSYPGVLLQVLDSSGSDRDVDDDNGSSNVKMRTSPAFLDLFQRLVHLFKAHHARYDWAEMERLFRHTAAATIERTTPPPVSNSHHQLPLLRGFEDGATCGPGLLDTHAEMLGLFDEACNAENADKYFAEDKIGDQFALFGWVGGSKAC